MFELFHVILHIRGRAYVVRGTFDSVTSNIDKLVVLPICVDSREEGKLLYPNILFSFSVTPASNA